MDVLDLVTAIGVVQGLMLLMGLLIRNWGKPNHNYYFLILVAGVSLALLSKLLYSQERYHAYPQLWFLADTVAYLIGPLWYLTVRRSAEPRVRFGWLEWGLLTPVLYHVIFLVLIFLKSNEAFWEMTRTMSFQNGFYWFAGTVIFVNLSFMGLAQRYLNRFKNSLFPPLLLHGQRAMIAVMIIWMGSFALGMTIENFKLAQAYEIAFVALAFLTLSLGMLAIMKPASFYFLTQTFDAGESLVLQKLAAHITETLSEQKSYQKPDFQLGDLSEQIGSNPVLTSKAINRQLKTNFNDLLNTYRVNHFLELVQTKEASQYTHWAMAQESGFGNKVSFYNAFKKLKGTTPKKYLTEAGIG